MTLRDKFAAEPLPTGILDQVGDLVGMKADTTLLRSST